jgi:hypothetical protein
MTHTKPNYAPTSVAKHCSAYRPELIITRTDADDWTQHNPHAQPGVLDDLAAAGIIVIIEGPAAPTISKKITHDLDILRQPRRSHPSSPATF